MKTVFKASHTVENLGILDRVLRITVAFALVTYAALDLTLGSSTMGVWQALVIVGSVYPFLTGILGTDPFYKAADIKSCDLSEKNQCGSFPYQMDAALGHHPIPSHDDYHSLSSSRHEK